MARMIFYDVESLRNIFTIALYKEPSETMSNGHIDIFYLSSIPLYNFDEITQRIYLRNGNFKGTVSYYDLRKIENGILFAHIFGGIDDNIRSAYGIGWFPSDIAIQAANKQSFLYYLCGYNSYNYDTTIIAYMMSMMFVDARTRKYGVEQNLENDNISTSLTPSKLRDFNNIMFADKDHMTNALRPIKVANNIRKAMIGSGRHIDIARLNEKQSKVGLKRLLGTLGYQILESDKLSDTTDTLKDFDEVCELIAYNVSDVVNLANLAHHKVYASNFELKQGLLDSYPEIVIEGYKKDIPISPDVKLRNDRKMADSSSSQLASMALCPNGHLPDNPQVSFSYPSIEKAKEQGRVQENILQITNDWFCNKFPDPLCEARQYWERVYRFYSYLEGKNFNQTLENKDLDFNIVPKATICMPYFDTNGNPTSCYVTFSVGGIHGAEYNKPLYDSHMKKYNDFYADVKILEQELAKYSIPQSFGVSGRTGKTTTKYGTPVYTGVPTTLDSETQARIFYKLKTVTIDGVTYDAKDYVNGSGKWKNISKPQLFVGYNDPIPGYEEDHTQYNCKKLNKKYTYTSYGNTQHEDFTSYYPNLLIQMEAFLNPELGYDRYEEIFEQKETLGKQMKDKSIDKELRAKYSIQRNGTKLILNSASGAGDAKFDNPIRMNNKIISMRIIGQMFTWRIGQAQTFAGARVISTNTDGLYVIPMPPLTVEESNRILEEESKSIHVAIEPEPVYLISKDSNNRLEYDVVKSSMITAGGGALSCYDGPTPTQALSHPAVLDKALCMYLLEKCAPNDGVTALNDEFDRNVGYRILDEIRNDTSISLIDRALYFQNMVASSPGTNSYNFYYKNDVESATPDDIVKIIQHYNRVFYFNKKPYTVHLQRIHMRKATGLKPGQRPPHQLPSMLKWYCEATGEQPDIVDKICQNKIKEIAISKITGITPDMNILIENHDLHQLPSAQLEWILSELDLQAYLKLFESAYNNWRNPTPDCEFERQDEDDED
jgi:hypothetical protein